MAVDDVTAYQTLHQDRPGFFDAAINTGLQLSPITYPQQTWIFGSGERICKQQLLKNEWGESVHLYLFPSASLTTELSSYTGQSNDKLLKGLTQAVQNIKGYCYALLKLCEVVCSLTKNIVMTLCRQYT